MTKTFNEVPIDLLRARLSYNPETGVITRKFKNGVTETACKAGYRGYRTMLFRYEGRNIKLRVHRVAWALNYGEWPKSQLDHRDRDKANNAINNLRLSDARLNSRNRNARGAVG